MKHHQQICCRGQEDEACPGRTHVEACEEGLCYDGVDTCGARLVSSADVLCASTSVHVRANVRVRVVKAKEGIYSDKSDRYLCVCVGGIWGDGFFFGTRSGKVLFVSVIVRAGACLCARLFP